MKKKYMLFLTGCILALTLSACGKQAEAPAEEAAVEESVEAPSEDTSEEAPVVGEALNQYLSNVGDMSDAWGGTLGVATMTIDNTYTFAQVNGAPPSGYSLAYFKIGDETSSTVGDLTRIPNEGVFTVAYLPENITNTSDERLIEMKFGVPYDVSKNPRQNNLDQVPLGEFKIQEVTFNVHKSNGEETGVGLSVPGFTNSVLTKDDMLTAFGSDNMLSDASSSIEFAKAGSVYTNTITGNFIENGLLTKVNFVYDVNYGIDVTMLGDAAANLGNFQNFVEGLDPGTYYAVYREGGKTAKYVFIAAPDSLDANGHCYSASVYGIWGGVIHDYTNGGFVNSSQIDEMPIKVSSIGNIMCASATQIVNIYVDNNDGAVSVASSGSYSADENGNPIYEINMAGNVSSEADSTNFDAMVQEYEQANSLTFVMKE